METYVIEKGDTVEGIANKFNIPAIEIIRANSLVSPYLLIPGNILNIPVGKVNIFDYYNVSKNDTLYSIALNNNTTVSMLAKINGLDVQDYIYPGQTLLVPKKGILTYITNEGDTLNTVSKYFNTYPQDILYSNNSIYLLPEQLIVYRKL